MTKKQLEHLKLVVYQVYPRSFKDSNGDGIGDLNGITEKLDYIKDLGVNAIWLSPCYKSPNEDNGYDISDYRDIMDEFGTLDNWKRMIAEIHKRDMKLIMDFVANHSSVEHMWFQEARKSKDNPYRDYYYWADELLYSGNESVLCARPDIDAQCVTYWGSVPEGYSLELLNDLVDSYLSQYEALKDNECYRLEFLDLSRQLIAEKGRESLKKIQNNFTNHQYVEYKEEQERFFKLIDLDEELLSTNDKTNINNWVKRAEDYAEDEKDKAMLVFNAKNLLMLWASVEGSSLLHDYAYREWCGIMQHYKNRWKFYFEKLDECFDSGEKPNIDFTQLDLEFAKSTYVCINSDKELNELVKASIAI